MTSTTPTRTINYRRPGVTEEVREEIPNDQIGQPKEGEPQDSEYPSRHGNARGRMPLFRNS